MLSPDQVRRYHDDGYLMLKGYKSAAEIDALRERALAIVEAFDPAEGSGIFSTRDAKRSEDAWFLDSADKVRCFFEEEAFGPDGRLRQPKALSINKIGHAMHDLDPVFERFSRGPRMQALAADLGIAEPLLWQSMVIFKQPGIGGEVRWHQDATYFYTEPISVTTFWFALEDATPDNGCLWVEPGGHRGPLRERFVRNANRTELLTLDRTPWPDRSRAVPLAAPAGSLICLHGLLPHCSAPNRSVRSRHAYTLHVTDARSVYAASNWLQRGPQLPVRGLDLG
jgi:phytanoyl-CoA hydroxylase